jgi:hypothetical protein
MFSAFLPVLIPDAIKDLTLYCWKFIDMAEEFLCFDIYKKTVAVKVSCKC